MCHCLQDELTSVFATAGNPQRKYSHKASRQEYI
jgi:hypothetical protein